MDLKLNPKFKLIHHGSKLPDFDKKEIKLTREQRKEVEARVEFKMKDVKSWLKNQIGLKWQQAFQSGEQKYEHYLHAFQELEREINKEANMPLPTEMMREDDFYKRRDEAVDKFDKLFKLRETGQLELKIRKIVNIVESLLY